MATGVVVWSKTAATNNTIDSAVNYAEGQAPSSVNDSARGAMASTAKWRDDLNGSLTTSGTSTAYAVTTNQGFAALTAGYEVTCQFDEDCGATVTLNVDGLGAKPLRSAAGVELVAGAIKAGSVHRATYFTSNSGEWLLHDVNPTIIAAGQVVTASITDKNVTYAKIQDVSAQYKILARKSASAGPVEECSLSEVLDFVTSAANGDILIRSSGAWTRLAKATDGNALVLASGLPAWGASPSQFQISAQTASTSATLSFTSGIDATYREYNFAIDSLLPSTDDVYLIAELSTDGGSSWVTTNYKGGVQTIDYGGTSAINSATASWILSQPAGSAGMDNGTGNGFSGLAKLNTPSSSSVKKAFSSYGQAIIADGATFRAFIGGGTWTGANTAINAIRFRFSSGNIASGTITMYGVK